MSGQQRKFDHDEARTLYESGWYSKAALARRFGVTSGRMGQVLDPELQARALAAQAIWTRANYKTPCRKCGTPIWKHGHRKVTGLCRKCVADTRRTAGHGTESRYKRGCHCDDCRRAATEARARRRARTKNNAQHDHPASNRQDPPPQDPGLRRVVMPVQHQTGPDASLLEDRGTGARGGQA